MKKDAYYTSGQFAKKAHVTLRAIRYYDKQNILKPSARTAAGARLYTDADLAKLQQILLLKYLGFSLDDIKNKLISLDTPEEVATVLNEQSLAIQQKIEQLTEAVTAIETLKNEVLQMQVVDFKKYADIIIPRGGENLIAIHMLIEHLKVIMHQDSEA